MPSNNEKQDANVVNNKHDLLSLIDSSKVTNAASPSAKPKKGNFVMVTNETLQRKTKKKSLSISKKSTSKKNIYFNFKKKQAIDALSNAISKKLATLDSYTSFTVISKNQATFTPAATLTALSNENTNMENSDLAHQSQEPKLSATHSRVELAEVDANILSTANSKTKTAVTKRTKAEMEDNSSDTANKASVPKKERAHLLAKDDIVLFPSAYDDFSGLSANIKSNTTKVINEKEKFLEKNRENELQKGFRELDERLEKEDKIIDEQRHELKNICKENSMINERIETLLSQMSFVQNSILQSTNNPNTNTADISNLSMIAETMSKKITTEETSLKMVSFLQSIDSSLKEIKNAKN